MTLEECKRNEGKQVSFFFRGKKRPFILVAAQVDNKPIKYEGIDYHGYIGDVRLNYAYPKKGLGTRSTGFWTKQLDKITP